MKAMHRRTFLRGLAGAVVAAPFLGSVWERAARGQTSAPAPPRPLIVMFTHYGCVTTRWFPQKSHGALVAGDIANSIAPLAPYVSKLLIPRGIRAMNEWTQNNTGAGHGRGQGNDAHINACGSYFTCQPVTPNTDNPFDFSQAVKFDARPISTSLDHMIAQQLSPGGTPLFMRVGNTGGTQGETPQSNISYLKVSNDPTAAATPYPGLGTPQAVFTSLTGLFGQGSPSPDTYAAARGKMVSDLVRADLDSFKRLNMSKDDRNKIDVWEAMLNTTGSSVAPTPGQCTADVATRLGATQAAVDGVGMSGGSGDVLTTPVTATLDGADMYSVMAALSAICNYNPISVIKYPPNYLFKGLGLTIESASLSHRLNNANLSGYCYPGALMNIETIDRYYATKFATLIGMLDSVAGSTGTLLDDSAVVWFQEMSDGLAQNLNNLPIMQAGGCGGYFKTGWTINVEDGSATLTQGHSESQCADGSMNGMVNGLDETTGTPSNVANAPINKYFYNLMNAVGAKGDATSGYPTKGGTGPVTKFGYSDLTTDFCGGLGAVANASIHSPGEYTALKANP